MTGEEPPAQARSPRIIASGRREYADERETRVGKRIALTGRREQQRSAAVLFKIGGMGREPRD